MNPTPASIYKSMILSNPFKHKWREDCLFTIFFDSNSPISVSEDGLFVSKFQLDDSQVMNHDLKPYEKMLNESTLSKKEIQVRKEYERQLYFFIESNIDLISASKVHFNPNHNSYDNNYSASIISNNSLIFHLPKMLDPLWIDEIKTACSIGMTALWKEFCGELKSEDKEIWKDESAFYLYENIKTVLEQLKKVN